MDIYYIQTCANSGVQRSYIFDVILGLKWYLKNLKSGWACLW